MSEATEAWTLHSAALVGPYHLRQGEGSQDYGAWGRQGDLLVMAVADGAGSKRRSLEGATFVALQVVERLLARLQEEEPTEALLEEVALEVRQDLLATDEAQEKGCTLALAVLSPEGWWAWVLGDAFVVVHQEEHVHRVVQPPRRGEYANVTELMTSPSIHPLAASGGKALGATVTSDGLLSATVERGEAVEGVWTPLLKRACADALDLQGFLTYMEGKGLIEDDTTLIMAVEGGTTA